MTGEPINPTFDERGLAPAIIQDLVSGKVLMLAWMNEESLNLTLKTNKVYFWSRSRQVLWRKGETSGNTLSVSEIRIDCDQDTFLILVNPAGPTCHTGQTSCFYRKVALDGTLQTI